MRNIKLFLVTLMLVHLSYSHAQEIYKIPEGIQTRWASPENPNGLKGSGGQANNGRKGHPSMVLISGESYVLADVQGTSGIIHRIWMTISRSNEVLRGLRLDFYWDGAKKPAVSAPFGDFFCLGLGKMIAFESALFSSPEGRSINCFVPMPFKTGMKIMITNESDKEVELYYDIDYTIGDKLGNDVMYFHAFFNRENPTQYVKDYTILPELTGKGRFLGVNIGIIANKKLYYKSWWGEGEVKVYIDGDNKYPTLCGTGSEDYIGTGWGQGQYSHLYQGCIFADKENMQFCFYRFHLPDPIYFYQNIKITIQQIGCWDPQTKPFFGFYKNPVYKAGDMSVVDFSSPNKVPDYDLYERQDDVSSCCYFYYNKPENNLPELQSIEKRLEGLK